jgi:4-diphosphocytidyl-2-C-methyl-D-erythritol kinase
MLTLKAPAKINWFLHVLGKREDGYHEIESLLQRISLYDILTFEHSETIEVVTEANIPLADNLVFKAATALREDSGYQHGARITLDKNIPLAAGLGGGSSDAAAALAGLNKMWGTDFSNEELSEMAASIGSDIPFFLNGATAIIEGRGERVIPVEVKKTSTLLLLKPPFGVPAGWAYSNVVEPTGKSTDIKSFIELIDYGDYKFLGDYGRNDLEDPVSRRHPEIMEMKEALYNAGAEFCVMSGSGPTVFGVFGDRGKAESVRASIEADWSAIAETLI